MKIPSPARSSGASLPPSALRPERCLAKSRQCSGRTEAGRTVEEHCRIAGAVAAVLVSRLNDVLPGLLPPGADIPALLHDIGKVCPTFQARLYDAVMGREARLHMPELATADVALDRQLGGHAAVSRACLADMGAPTALARIVGAHHGKAVQPVSDSASVVGGVVWQKTRRALCRRLMEERPDWPDFGRGLERVVCGLTVTADWIASGPLFDDPAEDWRPLVERAVDEAGFLWPGIRRGLTFEDVFSFAPRPAQRTLFEAVEGPGVFVLEAPMGVGKTEAALYAAYRLLEQKKSCGIYFALPTQLTSNRIHGRVNAFLDRILREPRRALLLHGMAWLERFQNHQRMGREAAPNQAWFSRGRRGILAPFGVGTIDQALFSALHVRYGALRTFGLAGKTVILDEVHSYDAYTGSILDALTRQLRDIGCTVIILSATLTAKRRAALLPDMPTASTAYPLISAAPAGGTAREIPCDGGASAEVALSHLTDGDAVEEALQRAEQGERVLWVENTVAEAQERFCLLAGRASAMDNLPVGLLHSRFTPADRARNEERWTAFFHPRANGRGRRGGIVVGTQVVEQSLDLDADFLVSRFCPTDMLLQRLGRLWRHGERTPRPASARRQACILHPTPTEAATSPEAAFGPSAHVYAPYVLFRSLEIWYARTSVCLPEEIRPLLEATYADREESAPAVAAAWRELCRVRDMLRRQALLVQSDSVQPGDDAQARTRWQEREDAAVVLFRSRDAAGRRLVLADGRELELRLPEDDATQRGRLARWQKRQEAAVMLAENTVRVAAARAPEGDTPGWLAPWLREGIRAARLTEDGRVLREDGSPPSHPARYDPLLGYALTATGGRSRPL